MTRQLDASGTRVHDVDALRGFALLGIFIVNITFMASGYPGNLATDPAYDSTLDDLVRGLSSVLVDMKFYLLFSFLFGYSFTLQVRAAERAGTAFAPRMLRRIAGLLALGVLNLVLLFSGDILTTYALTCLVLFAMRGVRDRTALRVGGAIYGLVLLSLLVSGLLVDRAVLQPSPGQAQANAEHATRAMLGGWTEVIGQHLDGIPLLVLNVLTVQGPTALAMFLFGMVAGRRQLLGRICGDERVLRRIQRIGFPIGLVGGSLYALGGPDSSTLASAISTATAPLLAAAYAATLLRLMHSPRAARLRNALAPAGRIALTNYLAQSLVGLLIFTGIGLGAAGSFSPAATSGLAILVFAIQLAASAWWLRRHPYGPAEWALRWLTNGTRPAWRTPNPHA